MARAEHSAADVAAELRRRIPGVGTKKLHKLLYYSQGHHLAMLGRPLFHESIKAWDMGPVVGALWRGEREDGPRVGGAPLGQAELNTIGYVVSRYGALTGRDLEILSHSEDPWREADALRRQRGERAARISNDKLAAFFRAKESMDQQSDDSDVLATERLTDAATTARGRLGRAYGRADDEVRLRARLAEFLSASGAK